MKAKTKDSFFLNLKKEQRVNELLFNTLPGREHFEKLCEFVKKYLISSGQATVKRDFSEKKKEALAGVMQ